MVGHEGKLYHVDPTSGRPQDVAMTTLGRINAVLENLEVVFNYECEDSDLTIDEIQRVYHVLMGDLDILEMYNLRTWLEEHYPTS